jgi:hypothetical protein
MKTKCDDSLTNFILTLKNSHNTSGRKFTLMAEKKEEAICCDPSLGPRLGGNSAGIRVDSYCNGDACSSSHLGYMYTTLPNNLLGSLSSHLADPIRSERELGLRKSKPFGLEMCFARSEKESFARA